MAYYVHCFCHRLNLVIVDVVKSVKCIGDMIALFKDLHSFVSSSTVHVRWEQRQDHHKVKKMEIGRVSDTRWSCQAKQFDVVWKRLDIMCEVLQDVIDNDTNPQRKVQATGYLLQIDRRFVRYLYFIRLLLMKAKYSSDILQSPSNDLTEAIELVETLKEELREIRTRESCQQLWEAAEEKSVMLNLPENARPVRQRALPQALRDYAVVANVEEQANNGFEGYAQDVFEVIDCVGVELERRFDHQNMKMMEGISSLTPKSQSFLDEDIITEFASLFNADIDALRSEISTFKHLLQRKSELDRPNTLLEMQRYALTMKDAFYELSRLLTIACTLPISSAECERNFSSMRLIKNDLRSVMTNERLDSLMVLGIHRDRAGKINLDSVVDMFKAKYPKCRISL